MSSWVISAGVRRQELELEGARGGGRGGGRVGVVSYSGRRADDPVVNLALPMLLLTLRGALLGTLGALRRLANWRLD